MREFRNGVGLFHELRQLGTSEEFLDRACHGTGVDKRRGFHIGGFGGDGHTLLDNSFKTEHTFSELMFQKFADGADATVRQVVDIVGRAETIGKTLVVSDCRYDVFKRQVSYDKFFHVVSYCVKARFVAFDFVKKFFEVGIINLFQNSEFLGIAVDDCVKVDGVVADDFEFNCFLFAVFFGRGNFDVNFVHGVVLDFFRFFFGDDLAFFGKDFAGENAYDVAGDFLSLDTGSKAQLFVELIPADSRKVVTTIVEEVIVDENVRAFEGGNFAGTHSSEQVDFARFFGVRALRIAFTGVGNHLFFEYGVDLVVRAVTQSP